MNATLNLWAMNLLRRCWSYYIIVIILSCLFLTRLIIKRYAFVRNLAWIPGPPAIPVLGNSLSLGGQVEFFRLLLKCSQEYGAIFKLWIGTRPFVFISNADYAQPILSSKLYMDKSYEYNFLKPWVGNGLLTSTGSHWHQRRKLLTPTFHYSILEEFIEPIIDQSSILIDCLSKKVGEKAFDVMSFIKLCALDIICVTAMGKSVNAQLNEDHKYVKAVDGMNEILQRRFITPWLKPDFIFNRSPMGMRQRELVKTINEFVGKVISEKKKSFAIWESSQIPEKKRKARALLELILLANENGDGLNDDEIRDEVNTFMFAGHDTTSVALGWCLFVLGKRPEIQEKILDEYRKTIGFDIPKYRDIQKLEYLECVIKEVLRLYPAVPLIARDIKHDVPISKNKTILPGVTALIFAPSLHRDPHNFKSPNEFIPERFLNEKKDFENPFAYIPFSAGPRNCIGSKFAMLELKLLLHSILEKFVITSVEPEQDLNLYSEIVLLNRNGIQIQLKNRIQ